MPGALKGTSNENTEYAPLIDATSSSSSTSKSANAKIINNVADKSLPPSSKSLSNNGFNTPKKASSTGSAKGVLKEEKKESEKKELEKKEIIDYEG